MMKKRKFTEIKVDGECYVTSSFSYWVTVYMKDNGALVEKDFLIDVQAFVGFYTYLRMPIYVIIEVMKQLRNMNTNKELLFYEFDTERVKRYSNLKYHSQQLIDMLLV